eukprot:gene16064-19616_t
MRLLLFSLPAKAPRKSDSPRHGSYLLSPLPWRPRLEIPMNLYVSNLAYGLTDEELRSEFAAFGTVTSARVVLDRESGRSRGFGFVE